MNRLLRVLLVEDSLDDAELLVIELENSGYNPIYRRVDISTLLAVPEQNWADSNWDIQVLAPTNTEQWLLTQIESLDIAMQYLGGNGTSRTGKSDRFDVVLLDLSLPDSVGLDTLKQLQYLAPALPVVVLTGVDNRSLALDAMAAGAQDYLVIPNPG